MSKPAEKRPPVESTKENHAAGLKGSPGLLRFAWILLAVWISLLAALALHVVGVW